MNNITMAKKISSAEPGQAVKIVYSSEIGSIGTFSLETDGLDELSVTGSATPNGFFYFVCIGYAPDGSKKFVADRVIQTNISWETLNEAGAAADPGMEITIGKSTYIIKLPNTLSALSFTPDDNSEWDEIMEWQPATGSLETDFWHTESTSSWALTTPVGTPANRIVRGASDTDSSTGEVTSVQYASTYTGNDIGFRPILLAPQTKASFGGSTTYPQCQLPTCNVIAKARPGMAVPCAYTVTTTGTLGTFSQIGTSRKEVISDKPGDTPDGTFYFVCVGYEPGGQLKFVADRVIQDSITWETLNTAGLCTHSGMDAESLTGVEGSILRLMSSNIVKNSQGKESSEWDGIIYANTVGSADYPTSYVNDWNYSKTKSWMMDTPSMTDDLGNEADMARRIVRGGEDKEYGAIVNRGAASTFLSSAVGFRPVLSIPINKVTFLMTKTVVTPRHTYHQNVHIHHEFVFLAEGATLETTTFEYYLGAERVLGPIIPTEFSLDIDIPYTVFSIGRNALHLTVDCANKKKTIEYIIVREEPGDTTRSREYLDYDGGYDLGTLALSDGTISGEKSIMEIQTPKSIRIPNKLISIAIKEVE